jgi:hypothetical protein
MLWCWMDMRISETLYEGGIVPGFPGARTFALNLLTLPGVLAYSAYSL